VSRTERNKLNDAKIKGAARPLPKAGLNDGGNLHLAEMPATRLFKWRVLYRLHGKKATIWLGTYPRISLKEARRLRDEIEEQAAKGIDPKLVRKTGGAPATGLSFAEFAEKYADDLAPVDLRKRKEWLSMVRRLGALRDLRPSEITVNEIDAALDPIWQTKAPTARLWLRWIAAILRAAKVRGLIADPWMNPADWRVSFSAVKRKARHVETPREAMPYAEIPAFVRDLRARPGTRLNLALALELIVLSGVRASEALGAKWSEFDREAMVWTIPAERMKGDHGRHQVPLTAEMLDVLDRAAPRHGKAAASAFVFPAIRSKGGCYRPSCALGLFRNLRNGTATVHGFRSSFFDWTQDKTDFSDRLANAALAHVQKNREQTRVQRAYDRSNFLEKRRPMMATWNAYCLSASIAANADRPERIAEAA
jgi:integrase